MYVLVTFSPLGTFSIPKFIYSSLVFIVLTKILVATGWPEEDCMANSEVMDLVDKSLSCQNLAPFAKKTRGAIGALVNGIPLICGGYSSFGYSDECYKITKSMTSLVTKMNSKRYGADSVVVDNNLLWVLGGRKDTSTYLSSTEYISISEYVQIQIGAGAGPDLPLAVYEHAIVAWNSSYFMLIGGHDGDGYLAKTFNYHEGKQEWISGPELNQARSSHGVGLGMDTATSEHYIAVSGGRYDDYGSLDSVELLYKGETEWQAGNFKHQ